MNFALGSLEKEGVFSEIMKMSFYQFHKSMDDLNKNIFQNQIITTQGPYQQHPHQKGMQAKKVCVHDSATMSLNAFTKLVRYTYVCLFILVMVKCSLLFYGHLFSRC